ncbi:MAG: hypothetical protein AAFU85_06835 [Planctomycetota bacterium]
MSVAFETPDQSTVRPSWCVAASSLLVVLVLSFLAYPAIGSDTITWDLVDIEQRSHSPFQEKSVRAVALVFISTDCPIANSYQPLLRRLADAFEPKGIRFFLVHPTAGLSIEDARSHRDEYGIRSPVVVDADQSLTRAVNATVTPQAIIFTRDVQDAVYRGRIDNRYATFGKKRNVATTSEFADALSDIVAGREVAVRETKAVGCLISFKSSLDKD